MGLEGNSWRLYAINSGPGFVVPAKKVGCVVRKCPHSAGEVSDVLLIIHLARISMFARGSFCPTGHLRSCMIYFQVLGFSNKVRGRIEVRPTWGNHCALSRKWHPSHYLQSVWGELVNCKFGGKWPSMINSINLTTALACRCGRGRPFFL